MTLRRMSVINFRNLVSVDIELSPQLNIFYGDNGSGKTSLLEAMSAISLGRSFRSRKFKNTINHKADHYTIYGDVLSDGYDTETPVSVGLQRSLSGETIIKKSGLLCRSASELAETLPLRVVDGHSFSLLEGAPQVRREFLDWLVFHVEHRFIDVWRDYEKCLKQRNSLLRHGKIESLVLDSWDLELTKLGEELHSMRRDAFELLRPVFFELIKGFDELVDIDLNYYSGWDNESSSFHDLIKLVRDRDFDLGYTRQGPHRSDLKITRGRSAATEVLSRGQQKIVVSALFIAQGLVFKQVKQRRCLFLIDDLPAELDEKFRMILAKWLINMDCQVCVTGIERGVLMNAWADFLESIDVRVFHVEHGLVSVE